MLRRLRLTGTASEVNTARPGVAVANNAEAPAVAAPSEEAPGVATPPEEAPAAPVPDVAVQAANVDEVEHNNPDQAAILLHGMSRLTVRDFVHMHPGLGLPPAADGEGRDPAKLDLPPGKHPRPFASLASKTPDLLTTLLPPEVLFAVFERLDLHDLLALRRTCRRLRNAVPMAVIEKALKVQNHAGWKVVFEVNGTRYPGTTYGNRRLCGRCVVPKTRAHLIDGKDVRRYLLRRGIGREGDGIVGGLEDGAWPERWGMCFPCLWTLLASAPPRPVADDEGAGSESAVVALYKAPVKGGSDSSKEATVSAKTDAQDEKAAQPEERKKEIWELAGISSKEVFNMLDGSQRKICHRCKRDIHENAVPCPHCVDFSEWLRDRRRWL